MSGQPNNGKQPTTVPAAVWTSLYFEATRADLASILADDQFLDAEHFHAVVAAKKNALGDLRIFVQGTVEVAIPPRTLAVDSKEDDGAELHSFAVTPETARRLAEILAPAAPASDPDASDPASRVAPTAYHGDVSQPAVAPDRAAPAALGRYQILRTLGRGGMGIVYLAHDTHLDREVAVKVLPGALFAGAPQVERLLREARIGASLKHPNLCQVLDAGQEGGEFYFVMEYVEGRPLSALIDERPLPVAAACTYAAQLFDALRYLAERGIVHRDVKPGNLMVCEAERIKLLDLGLVKDLSRNLSRVTDEGAVMGTPSYMAPEQITDASRVTPSTDLYAAGMTLYEMLTGEAPFTGPVFSVLHQVLSESPPDLRARRPDLPAPLADLVTGLLSKEPADRPSHLVALQVLESLRGSVVLATPRPRAALAPAAEPLPSLVARIDEAARHIHDPNRDDLLDLLPSEGGRPRLGNYYLEERLGPRAIINSYRARQFLTDVPAVVRLLPPAFSEMAPEQIQALLKQQARLMQLSKRCRQFSQLMDVGRAELSAGNFKVLYYTVEEFLPGAPLEQRVRDGRNLSPAAVKRHLGSALRGLAALHGQRLLHGNLHAGKLYLDPETSELRIADLSLASEFPAEGEKPADAANNVLNQADWQGNRGPRRRQYIAPEVLSEGCKVGPLAEQFALGVIFVEALTGRFVRTDPNDLKLLTYVRADLEDRLLEIAEFSERLARVLRRMVATNAGSRYRDVSAAVEALAVRPQRRHPRPTGRAPRPPKKQRAGPQSSAFDVFISYRRETGADLARLIVERLVKKDVHAFLDVDSLSSGQFDEELLTTIENTPHFIVILTEGSLDRCHDPGDWLRREVGHAIRTRRNVIPVLMPRFRMPEARDLPTELRPLATYNGIPYDHVFFKEFIKRLLRFLK